MEEGTAYIHKRCCVVWWTKLLSNIMSVLVSALYCCKAYSSIKIADATNLLYTTICYDTPRNLITNDTKLQTQGPLSNQHWSSASPVQHMPIRASSWAQRTSTGPATACAWHAEAACWKCVLSSEPVQQSRRSVQYVYKLFNPFNPFYSLITLRIEIHVCFISDSARNVCITILRCHFLPLPVKICSTLYCRLGY